MAGAEAAGSAIKHWREPDWGNLAASRNTFTSSKVMCWVALISQTGEKATPSSGVAIADDQGRHFEHGGVDSARRVHPALRRWR